MLAYFLKIPRMIFQIYPVCKVLLFILLKNLSFLLFRSGAQESLEEIPRPYNFLVENPRKYGLNLELNKQFHLF